MVISSAHLEAIHQAIGILKENPIYLDTETTGLSMTDEIIEVEVID
jgi:uncharacterized protein YprB with RNaseH-like and TPR domain